ncbi:hypothetical protein VNO77_01509 [Canavalia gladiata]|uniref:Uncharacterized protein n=1 Tax=Canavalia gladiata TaxID=3824 RepID=A0AAN9MW69_CANGL
MKLTFRSRVTMKTIGFKPLATQSTEVIHTDKVSDPQSIVVVHLKYDDCSFFGGPMTGQNRTTLNGVVNRKFFLPTTHGSNLLQEAWPNPTYLTTPSDVLALAFFLLPFSYNSTNDIVCGRDSNSIQAVICYTRVMPT